MPIVFAGTSYSNVLVNVPLVEKNPSDWSEVTDGAYGVVTLTEVTAHGKTVQQRARVSVWNLEPKTEYQLIYYGDEENNDVWPYATCIGKARKTSTQGYFKSGSYKFDFMDFLVDATPQKLWVVLASDVDCEAGMMTAWNPAEYLFEHNTI